MPGFWVWASRYIPLGKLILVRTVVLTGGQDHWGKEEMPDMGVRMDVSEEEAEKLVKWILEMEE